MKIEATKTKKRPTVSFKNDLFMTILALLTAVDSW